MNVLQDDRFGIGFEYEFVILDELRLMGRKKTRPINIGSMNHETFSIAFESTVGNSVWLDSMVRFNERYCVPAKFRRRHGRRYINEEDYAIERNLKIPRMIALMKCKPRKGKWYTYSPKTSDLVDVTERMQADLDALDITDIQQVDKMARRLNRHFVDIIEQDDEHEHLSYKARKVVKRRFAKEFGNIIGHKVKFLGYDNHQLTKKKPDWYLHDEDTNDIPSYHLDSGIELTTPVGTPAEAMEWIGMIHNAIASPELPLRTLVGPDCGIHINISHPEVTHRNASRLWFTMNFDESYILSTFGREASYHCTPLLPKLRNELQRLSDHGVISVSAFDNEETRPLVLNMIEACLQDDKSSTVSYVYMKSHGYAEYRMAGGADYLKQEDAVKELLGMLLHAHINSTSPKEHHLSKLRGMILASGAGKNNGKSLIETVPRTIFDT